MGYRYKKVNNRKILIEGPRLQSQKIKFLRQYLQLVDQNVTFVFLNETWIYEHGSAVRRWVFEGDRRGMPEKVCMNEGKRFTILHAGGKFGFLEGCDLFLDSKVDSRDYHKTMTGDLFKQWTEQQLIPNVKQMSGKVVVIMDNAPYHSVHAEQLPNFSWKKSKLQLWLHQNEIPFDSNLTKKQLYEIIKPNILSRKKYLIDELLSKNGIQVLRLPPYHCQYNPIEMVWGFCKQYDNKHILEQPSGKLKVANLWKKALSKYTPEMWLNSVKHCEQIINEDRVRLMGNESVQDIPPIIISLADSDDESIISFRSESTDDISLEDENLECSEEEDERKIVCKDEQMICLLETTESENQSDVELLTVEFVD
ncbi:hypothetical protein Zmor_014729 [Zophobas morio]|uniref:Tc1-like transposase DDE domain-containing protein n=2 Tax=Zophobas morio TaxID=2755281 RepID=A0AA38IF91_9CUCU|nr:hypothetical protein Zmor_014729 [Zophobas morio]